MKLFPLFSLVFFALSDFCALAQLSGWTLHRNDAFVNHFGHIATVMRDWIFSKKSSTHSNVKDSFYQSSKRPSSVSFSLYGSVHSTAYWFADVYLGSPRPQRQSLIVDTGSSVMGFPCSDCQNRCGRHIDLPYDRSVSVSVRPLSCFPTCPLCARKKPQFQQSPSWVPDSTTITSNQCAYHVRYTEGSSLTGSWFEDQITLSSDAFGDFPTSNTSLPYISAPVPFGCHLEETHLFLSQDASGILGLEATSRFGPAPFVTSVLANLLDLKRVNGSSLRDLGLAAEQYSQSQTEPVFGVCISQQGGILSIGASNERFHTESSMGGNSQTQRGGAELPSSENQQQQPSSSNYAVTTNLGDDQNSAIGTTRLPSGWTQQQNSQANHRSSSSELVGFTSRGRQGRRESREYKQEPNRRQNQSQGRNELDERSSSSRSNRYLIASDADKRADFQMASFNVEQFNTTTQNVDKSQATNTRQSKSSVPRRPRVLQLGMYYPAIEKHSNPWTPLVVDPDEEGGWPGSYTAILQEWKVKGAADGETVLIIPYSQQSLRTRTSVYHQGLPALIDSGTTLTYLPFLLYTSLWASLMKNIAAAKTARRQLMNDRVVSNPTRKAREETITRVSGASISTMKEKLNAYIEKLEKDDAKSPTSSDRQLRETTTASQSAGIVRELRLARQAIQDLDEVEDLIEPKKHVDISEGDSVKRIIDELRTANHEGDNDGSCDESLPVGRSATPLRRLAPVAVATADEECWFLSDEDMDLKYFPDMLLQFANRVKHVWRATSYLYRKGKSKVYCLTIVSEETPPSSSSDGQMDVSALPGRSLVSAGPEKRRLQKNVKQAVLGSSFFINHDLVFHLGRWELASIEASCPLTNLEKRRKS